VLSNFRRYFVLRASTMTNPVVLPPTLVLRTVHGRWSSGLSSTTGPRRTSSGASARAPMRFVNHVESGTSSSALTPSARCDRGNSSARVSRR